MYGYIFYMYLTVKQYYGILKKKKNIKVVFFFNLQLKKKKKLIVKPFLIQVTIICHPTMSILKQSQSQTIGHL